jgi:hypothetical protein
MNEDCVPMKSLLPGHGSDGTDAGILEDGISHINKSGVLTKNWFEGIPF